MRLIARPPGVNRKSSHDRAALVHARARYGAGWAACNGAGLGAAAGALAHGVLAALLGHEMTNKVAHLLLESLGSSSGQRTI